MIKVGRDEFCLTCMEWRTCDEQGRCIICGNIIQKKPEQSEPGYGEESSKDIVGENEE